MLFSRGGNNFFVEEVVDHHGRFPVFGTPAVIITDIRQAFLSAEAAHPGIQIAPESAVFSGVDVAVQAIQFGMVQVNPVQDASLVISSQIEVFKPDKVAIVLGSQNNLFHIRDARENGRYEAGRLHPGIIELSHRLQTSFDADAPVHLFSEIFFQRIDAPAHAGIRESLDEVQVPKNKVALR